MLRTLNWIAFALVIVGGLNWGLVGLFDVNLVTEIFGTGGFANTIYILVGLGALYMVYYAVRVEGEVGDQTTAPHVRAHHH